MKSDKHYQISAIIIIVITLVTYIFPFILFNIDGKGNNITWEQIGTAFLFLLPAIVLFMKKPNSLWVYSYPAILLASMLVAITGGDALGAGLLMLFVAIPLAIIYSLLVFFKVIK